MQINGKIVQTWMNLLTDQCQNMPGNQATVCQLVASMGFGNFMNAVLAATPEAYCTDITLCSANPLPSFVEPAVIQHCGPCVEFMNDFFLIAKVRELGLRKYPHLVKRIKKSNLRNYLKYCNFNQNFGF